MPAAARTPSPPPSTFRALGKALAFCFFFSGFVLALSCIALSRDTAQLRAELQANFASGALVPGIYIGPDARRGRYLANDCLILQTLVAGSGSVIANAVNSPVLESGPGGTCHQLHESLATPAPQPTYSYSRYFWGAKSFAGPALAFASLDAIKSSLRFAVYLVLALAAAVAAFRLLRGGPHPRGLYVTVLAAAAALATLYDLWHYAVTLAHGFSELVLAGYLLHAVLAPPADGDAPLPWRSVVLGCFTAWFELLTGPMVMAIGLTMLVEAAAAGGVRAPQRAVRAGLATALSVVACLLFLQVFVVVLGDARNAAQFFWHAALRMQLHQWLPIPVEAGWEIAENMKRYSAADVYAAVVGELLRLTRDNARTATVVFGASAAILAAALVAGRLRRLPVQGFLVYVFVPLLLVTWYLVFSNHTVIHAWAMVRIAVLLPLCAALAAIHAMAPPGWWQKAPQP